jgi:hypothetical protein
MQDWDLTPFKTLGPETPGLTGGVALVANGLGLTQSATYNVIRTLSVSHALNLRQSDYWIETVSDVLGLTQTASEGQDLPRGVTHSMSLTDAASVSGGRACLVAVHEALSCNWLYAGQPICVKSDGYILHAASHLSSERAGVAGIIYSDGGAPICGSAFFIADGELELDDWTAATGSVLLTPGAPYYLSDTEGVMTPEPPSTDSDYVVKVGRAISTRIFALELGEGVVL